MKWISFSTNSEAQGQTGLLRELITDKVQNIAYKIQKICFFSWLRPNIFFSMGHNFAGNLALGFMANKASLSASHQLSMGHN